jgi:predicted transposase YbfD/YdcC
LIFDFFFNRLSIIEEYDMSTRAQQNITMEDLWVVLTRLDRQVQELRERQTMDETAYLMSTDANRKHLLQAIADVDAGKNMVEVPLETFTHEDAY